MSSEGEENFYPSAEEAAFRLNSTVVEYDGGPVFIHRVDAHSDGILRLRLSSMPYSPDGTTPKTFSKKISDPLFRRFQTVGLGWCNHFGAGSHASYIERIPVRRSKQGLDSSSFKSCRPIVGSTGELLTGVRYSDLFYSEGFAETVKNLYPSLEEAMEVLSPDSSIALSRDFLCKQNENGVITLWYKKQEVGPIVKNRIYLFEKFSFLKELIESNPHLTREVEIGV